jgi:hypothetical protein
MVRCDPLLMTGEASCPSGHLVKRIPSTRHRARTESLRASHPVPKTPWRSLVPSSHPRDRRWWNALAFAGAGHWRASGIRSAGRRRVRTQRRRLRAVRPILKLAKVFSPRGEVSSPAVRRSEIAAPGCFSCHPVRRSQRRRTAPVVSRFVRADTLRGPATGSLIADEFT